MRLMCNRRLDYAALSSAFGLNFTDRYAAQLNSMDDLEADGLIKRTETDLVVTDAGAPLLRVIAMRFDAHLVDNPQRHSKTI